MAQLMLGQRQVPIDDNMFMAAVDALSRMAPDQDPQELAIAVFAGAYDPGYEQELAKAVRSGAWPQPMLQMVRRVKNFNQQPQQPSPAMPPVGMPLQQPQPQQQQPSGFGATAGAPDINLRPRQMLPVRDLLRPPAPTPLELMNSMPRPLFAGGR